jgi:hypothetical protein
LSRTEIRAAPIIIVGFPARPWPNRRDRAGVGRATGREEMLTLFNTATSSGSEPAIKDFESTRTPMLHEHLSMARTLHPGTQG